MGKEFRLSKKYWSCKLDKNDLVKLVKMIETSFDSKVNFSFWTELLGLNIRSNDLEEFLQHDELPPILHDLKITALGIDEGIVSRRLELSLWKSGIRLAINGDDRTWVLGIHAQIESFLKEHRLWYGWFIESLPFVASAVPALFVISAISFWKTNRTYSFIIGIFFIAWITVIALHYKDKILLRVQIALKPLKTSFNRENITIVVAIASLIVSIVGGIVIPLLKNK